MIVLDTCAIIWLILEPKSLSNPAGRSIKTALEKNTAFFSTISYWEIAYAVSRGRVEVEGGFKEFVTVMNGSFPLIPVDLNPEIAELGSGLPKEINSDPADRIITATALSLKASLITADKNLRKSKIIDTIW
ncbi:MAG: type II toxin-antitoxin system VapC family toxin [Ignavibacteriota bacterium]